VIDCGDLVIDLMYYVFVYIFEGVCYFGMIFDEVDEYCCEGEYLFILVMLFDVFVYCCWVLW